MRCRGRISHTNNAPDVALAEWMQRFVDYIAAKRGMANSLRILFDANSEVFANTVRYDCDRLCSALSMPPWQTVPSAAISIYRIFLRHCQGFIQRRIRPIGATDPAALSRC